MVGSEEHKVSTPPVDAPDSEQSQGEKLTQTQDQAEDIQQQSASHDATVAPETGELSQEGVTNPTTTEAQTQGDGETERPSASEAKTEEEATEGDGHASRQAACRGTDG